MGFGFFQMEATMKYDNAEYSILDALNEGKIKISTSKYEELGLIKSSINHIELNSIKNDYRKFLRKYQIEVSVIFFVTLLLLFIIGYSISV